MANQEIQNQEIEKLKNMIDLLSKEVVRLKKAKTKMIHEMLIIALERDEAVLGGEIYTKRLAEERARFAKKYQ